MLNHALPSCFFGGARKASWAFVSERSPSASLPAVNAAQSSLIDEVGSQLPRAAKINSFYPPEEI
jgi:hypothetical protein